MLHALLTSPFTALLLAAVLLAGLRLAADRLTPWRASSDVPWGLRDLAIGACLFFGSLIALQSFALSLHHPDAGEKLLPVPTASAIQVGGQALALGFVFACARRGGARSVRQAFRRLGFGRGGHLRAIALGLLAFFAAVPLVQGLFGLWSECWTAVLGEGLPRQETLERVRSIEDPLASFFVHAVAGVFAPIAEEIAWRGFVQPVCVRALGPLRGIALTALFFVVLGHGPEVYLPLFGFSLLLGWLYERTGRLTAPIALHAALNLSTLFLPVLFESAGS
ncbi:MAG: CPBP family intramembrane metalloprotease [Planctomycetes bacterium]|nr:CPBP family intramembrane metalloprotease [Planctomycetota bacterium]